MNSSSPVHPAHVLWVELSTRITTRRLHFRSGDEESAVESLLHLFKATRALMREHPGDSLFLEVAGQMLNTTIRPYTARWHGWMAPDPKRKETDGRPVVVFRDPQVRRQFRRELRELQPRLIGYTKAFDCMRKGEAEDGEKIRDMISGREELLEEYRKELAVQDVSGGLGCLVPVEILPQVGLHWVDPPTLTEKEIGAKEFAFIQKRRGLPESEPLQDGIGLALSGGGIKSATFCLGVVQELVRRKIFHQVDYLSTVSGGGYLGTFISAYLGSGEEQGDKDTRDGLVDKAFNKEPSGRESRALRHLRNHSKYLLHGGLWGKLNIAGLLASGIVSNMMMVLPIPLLIGLVFAAFGKVGFWTTAPGWGGQTWIYSTWVMAGSAGLMVLLWLLLQLVQRFTMKHPFGGWAAMLRGGSEAVTLASSLLAAGAGLLWLYPAAEQRYAALWAWLGMRIDKSLNSENLAATLLAAVPVVLGAIGFLFRNAKLQKLIMGLFILSGPVFYLFVILMVTTKLQGYGWNAWWMALAVTAFWFTWSIWLVNINALAPHRYYRARLCECYLAVRGQPELGVWDRMVAYLWRGHVPKDEAIGAVKHLKLSETGNSLVAPYHLINAFVNLPASKNRNLRGRGGDFFMFSRDSCGSPATGYVKTVDLENADPRIDLGSAMAISGAAANTNMGWRSMINFRFLMTLLNVRLGYWIPNFRKWKKSDRKPGDGGNVGSPYLLAEMGGRIQENMNYLNLSDGGHIENLGAYELLRRRCKFIIAVDGGGNRELDGGDLQRLERYAWIDFGIEMKYDLAELQADADGMCRAQAILVEIDYGSGMTGWMVYLRPGITGIEPRYLIDHWRTNPLFPYEPLTNQAFTEGQFEGYRCLGEKAAASLFQPEFETDKDKQSVRDLFEQLRKNLLPDNRSTL